MKGIVYRKLKKENIIQQSVQLCSENIKAFSNQNRNKTIESASLA